MKGVYIVSSDTCNPELKKQTYKYFEDRNIQISQYPEEISSDEHFFLIIVPPEQSDLNSVEYICGKGIFTPLEKYFDNSEYTQIQIVKNVHEGKLFIRELKDYYTKNKHDFKHYGVVEVESLICDFEEHILEDVDLREAFEEEYQVNLLDKFANYAKSLKNTASVRASFTASSSNHLLLLLKK